MYGGPLNGVGERKKGSTKVNTVQSQTLKHSHVFSSLSNPTLKINVGDRRKGESFATLIPA